MKKRAIKILISFILFLVALIFRFDKSFINNGIFILAYIIVGFEIVKKAIRNIFRGKFFDENFLMTIATIGAFFVREFPEAVAVMLFYQVGELFQMYAVDKSRKSIASLMDIRPDYANVQVNDNFEKVDPDEVKIGDIIMIKPGEKVPLDGFVVEGVSTLDTKALTGETIPRTVKIGDEILSGCINLNGVIKVKVSKKFEESTVSKILDLVENASNKKSKSENFITKFAKFYTPIVVIIALILAIFPPLLLNNQEFSIWIYKALSFLVVSCPCALVISIPLSFFGGIGGASKMGVLVKGSNYLEAIANTEIVIFDKTGTLTEGVFEVQKVFAKHMDEEKLIELVAYSEYFSNHPIAVSVKEAYGKEFDKNRIDSIEEISGKGIVTVVDGKKIIVGNEKLMVEYGVSYDACNDIGTVLYIAIDEVFAGHIVIADKVKSDSKKIIYDLKKNNVKKTIMLTGDRKNVAEFISSELGIDEVFFELLPDEKVKKVEKLFNEKRKGGKLVFVGDGINDAPVLALSDIGIAMGGLGADAAIEAADIVIMNDEPSKILSLIKLSKKTMRIVKENIIFAIFVKVLVLLLSVFGIATMWEAVFADVGVSVIAIFNALRVLNIKNYN